MFRKSVVVLAAPLLLVVACAERADQGAVEVQSGAAAVSALHATPEAVADAGTAQFEMVMEMTGMGQAFELVAAGAYDSQARQMSMTMDMGQMFEQLAASTGETLPSWFHDPWQLVADGDTIYLRMPMLAMLTGADGWVSMSPGDLGAGAELGLGAGMYDPTKLLESLRGVGGEPVVVGEEEVRGVGTTHYRVEIDLAEALDQVPEAQRDAVEASLEQLGDLGGAAVPVDVWVDGDDLPRRLQMDVTGALGEVAGGDETMTLTMELFGYGDDVSIEVPPVGEVTPFGEVVGGLDGRLGS